MRAALVISDGPTPWRRAFPLTVLFVFFAFLVVTGAAVTRPTNVHSAVYAWAQAHPGDPVPVIVQTQGAAAPVTAAIGEAGGAVQRQFQIVSSLQAQVPAGAVETLARHPGVARISLDAPVVATGTVRVDLKALATTYPLSVNANDAWSKMYTGAGVGVAIVDTGITHLADFGPGSRLVADVALNPAAGSTADGFGHGTHIAGIVGGYKVKGKYIGVAPEANLINVKVADDAGNASLGDLIAGLQWVYDNRAAYNIRVVNLSLHSSVAESYKVSPLDAAVEALWFNGVFVVVAAGNLGSAPDAVSYPPANDPFVMTVGAIDDMGTSSFGDDVTTNWSSSGATQDGFPKPELLTPGRDIISTIDTSSYLYNTYPSKIVDQSYFRLSGTSMAAGVMSGVAALVLERHPDWTPGQLKCTLIATSRQLSGPSAAFKVPRAGNASNQSGPSCNSDAALAPSAGLGPVFKVGAVAWVLGEPSSKAVADSIGLDMAAAGIQGASLASVDWSAIQWSAIKWDAIKWDAIKWDAIQWSAIKWDAIKWDAVNPDGVNFSAIKWSAIKWDAIKWDAIKWSAIKWDAIKWDAIQWSAIKWDYLAGK